MICQQSGARLWFHMPLLLLDNSAAGKWGRAREQQGAWAGELMLGWGCPLLGRRKLGQTQAPGALRPLDHAPQPVLAGAQDGLQVLGQGANDHLNVQLGPMQCLLLHGELVALGPHLQGQWWSGAGNLHVHWPGLGRARRRLTSFSRSFRTRSTTSTSDLSFIQVSMFCHEKTRSPITKALSQHWAWGSAPASYRLTDGLKVQGLQFAHHLFAPLPVPAVKMRGLEKPPVGEKRQRLWDGPYVPKGGYGHPAPTSSGSLGLCMPPTHL